MSNTHYEEIGSAAMAMALQEQPAHKYGEFTGFASLKEVPAYAFAGSAGFVRTVKIGREYPVRRQVLSTTKSTVY